MEMFPAFQVLAMIEMEMFNFVWNRKYNSQTVLFRIDTGCCKCALFDVIGMLTHWRKDYQKPVYFLGELFFFF